MPYIESLYGKDWNAVANIPIFSHVLDRAVKKDSFSLTKTMLKPAEPTGPLEERVKNLVEHLKNINELPECNFMPFKPY